MRQETIDQVLKFREERNWKQFHNPKDLAISISLEAAELLEIFQWSAGDVRCEEKKDKMREELEHYASYLVNLLVKNDMVSLPVSKKGGVEHG